MQFTNKSLLISNIIKNIFVSISCVFRIERFLTKTNKRYWNTADYIQVNAEEFEVKSFLVKQFFISVLDELGSGS